MPLPGAASSIANHNTPNTPNRRETDIESCEQEMTLGKWSVMSFRESH